MNKPRVGVIMGGTSGEREVSLRSGHAVAAALARPRARRGADRSLGRAAIRGSPLRRSGIDVAFLRCTGASAKTAACKGSASSTASRTPARACSRARSPWTRSRRRSSFACTTSRRRPYYTVSADDELADLEEMHGSFGFPVIVKPRGEGSSLGVTKAGSLAELDKPLVAALDARRRRARRALRHGQRGPRRHPRRPRARRHRGRAQEGHLRLRSEVHARA